MRNVLNVFIVCEADWMPRQGMQGSLEKFTDRERNYKYGNKIYVIDKKSHDDLL